jgi:hypothetical protein
MQNRNNTGNQEIYTVWYLLRHDTLIDSLITKNVEAHCSLLKTLKNGRTGFQGRNCSKSVRTLAIFLAKLWECG